MIHYLFTISKLQAAYDKLLSKFGFKPEQLHDWPLIKRKPGMDSSRMTLHPGQTDPLRYNAVDLSNEIIAADFQSPGRQYRKTYFQNSYTGFYYMGLIK